MPAQAQRGRIPTVAEPEFVERALPVDFGREVCGSLEAAEQREWLATNGIGGYASGTIAGSLTRRYHGLLVAALKPPLGRTLLVAKLDETASCGSRPYALSTNRWQGGTIDPQGNRHIERFHLEGTMPVWTFALADAQLEKRVWMQAGANTTYVRYELVRGSGPIELELKAIVNYCEHHSSTRAGHWQMNVTQVANGLRVVAFEGATPFYLLSAALPQDPPERERRADVEPAHNWYLNYDLLRERDRGLDEICDHLHAGTFRVQLEPGEAMTLVFSTDPHPNLDARGTLAARSALEQALLERFAKAHPQASADAPTWVRQLVFAADQFIVARPLQDDPNARSVIAGYHWFGDWGRDTMIALPGLTLATGRPEVAAKILRTFARFVDGGMLPNVFTDSGEAPEYNTADATLWYFEAVRQYYSASRDFELVRELFPVLESVLDWHIRGTRYNIHMDPSDGLLFAGEPGVQLTWMDAKVGDWVVTPRIGKAVEINALWYNALVNTGLFARMLGKNAGEYEAMARRAQASFQKFWNADANYCFDVIDGPQGTDASLRPNQIFAVSLPVSPLEPKQQRAVVEACARQLLTSHGLRSLAPDHANYKGHYGGSPLQRDTAYHQGTVWGWLIGPFVLAHLRVYDDPVRARSFLEPLAHQLRIHGLGTLAEVFDGDPPFVPHGCISQAWSVAEVLRAWLACREHRAATAAAR